jgi:flagellar assembly protein FliH
LSEASAVSFEFEELEPSDPPPRDGAAQILARAAQEADGIREQARAGGCAEGREQGLRESAGEMQAALSALQEAVSSIEALRAEVAETVERDAIDLALALAGKILAGTLQARPEAIVDVVQGALRRVSERRSLSLLVNPGDLQVILDAIGDGRAATGLELCDLHADQRVGTGGVIVRTHEGEVDAGVATQLERAREVVAAELASGGPAE